MLLFEDSDKYYSVIFHINDKAAFEPYRKKLCELMMRPEKQTQPPLVEGADVRAIGYGNRNAELRKAEEYIDYVHNAIDYGDTRDLLSYDEYFESKENAKAKAAGAEK